MLPNISNVLAHALVLSAFSSANAARPFPTPSNPLSQQALDLRGGGNPFDVIDTTKTITNLGLTIGTATTLSTKTVLDKIGVENIDPKSLLVARRIGVVILSFSLAAYSLVVQDASGSTAMGIACIPTAVELAKTLFDGTHKDLGFPAAGQAIVLVISAIFSYSFLNESYLEKDFLLKLYSGWLVLNGILMGCFPKIACKAWGEWDATGLHVLQYYVSVWGFGLLSLGTLSGVLATDMSSSKALALSALPFISRFVLSNFV